jgi:hypothetical protein
MSECYGPISKARQMLVVTRPVPASLTDLSGVGLDTVTFNDGDEVDNVADC